MSKSLNIIVLIFLTVSSSAWSQNQSASVSGANQKTEVYPFDKYTTFIPIYNRQNLGSWKIQGKSVWTFEQEAFVGRQDASATEDSWLYLNQEWNNFALELEFYVPESCNSGIAIGIPKDSLVDPDKYGFEVQISDIPKNALTGSLFHGAKSKENNIHRPNQWNVLGIICEGSQIKVYLNKQLVLNETVEGSTKGIIALKIPKGTEFSKQVVKFRNLRLKDLNPVQSTIPTGYKGRPFSDSVYKWGAQTIPGKLECAYYDFGGEGIAYHDFEPGNLGNGGLNLYTHHQRPHATPYFWEFRKDEGVDISYTKDFADYSHTNNYYTPAINQLYVGWCENNEWLNYTVDVKVAGTYSIDALYANSDTTITFDVNNKLASTCKLPLNTGSYHIWNKAEIGKITFNETGLHLLTFHYNKHNNFAYFEFTLTTKKE
jgi:hypothetical protein